MMQFQPTAVHQKMLFSKHGVKLVETGDRVLAAYFTCVFVKCVKLSVTLHGYILSASAKSGLWWQSHGQDLKSKKGRKKWVSGRYG